MIKYISNFFKKKEVFEFFSLIPEIALIAPIVSASKFKPEVQRNAAKDFSEKKKDKDFGFTTSTSTAKCTGISSYARHGWVLVAWQDFVIETNGDGISFNWTSPKDQKKLTNGSYVGEMISSHGADQYADYIDGIPNSLRTIIKVNSSWRCIVPDGYYLQSAPLYHSNERRFTPLVGFLDNSNGISALHVQLLWHVLEGKTLIKAGTPLAHYMLIPKEQPEIVCTIANEKQLLLANTVGAEIGKRYVSDFKERKCVFSEIFKTK